MAGPIVIGIMLVPLPFFARNQPPPDAEQRWTISWAPMAAATPQRARFAQDDDARVEVRDCRRGRPGGKRR